MSLLFTSSIQWILMPASPTSCSLDSLSLARGRTHSRPRSQSCSFSLVGGGGCSHRSLPALRIIKSLQRQTLAIHCSGWPPSSGVFAEVHMSSSGTHTVHSFMVALTGHVSNRGSVHHLVLPGEELIGHMCAAGKSWGGLVFTALCFCCC